ncbi:ParB/RepB/Spo0J family partition protein [Telmatospirillum sp.]|uniref:ParB/RepB/Spo0J family partition protein n=1 Tax=Telmatospirillum sp. TaxID=2079197 RepID=UPI00284AB6C4|nr:ParB/RepB/Spo0J family partition protein [Telmatospirillum sp.]MDR3438984.1 ParB/RepB/Spo0J family partition protein [Telmatospirillum sp.]
MPPKPKLTEEQTADIRTRKAADPTITNGAFAAAFGVNESTISRILTVKNESAPGSTLATATHAAIHRNPRNPRKLFKPEAIEEMAASVAEKGILSPLLVRPHPTIHEAFELIAGERRWRGAGLAIERGAASAGFPIPIIVRPCDDREALELAMMENLQRQDMTPLEEAEGYHSMVEMGDSPADIERKLGVNRRTVQKRLRLVKDLTPQVREALAGGEISVETANILAAYCPASEQEGILEDIQRGLYLTTAALKNALFSFRLPATAALFDLSRYTGGWLEDEENPDVRYFANIAQFKDLQAAAVEEKKAELAKKYYAVEVIDLAKGEYFQDWRYASGKGHEKARAVIVLERDNSVEIHLDLVHESDLHPPAAKSTAATTAAPTEPTTKAHAAAAHRRKTAALQDAVVRSPDMAMVVVCMALLGSSQAVRIEATEIDDDDRVISDATLVAIAPILEKLSITTKKKFEIGRKGPRTGDPWNIDHTSYWRALMSLSPSEVSALFAALVALRTGTFSGYNPQIGDDPAPVAIAETLGLVGTEEAAGLTLQEQDLDGMRKDALLTVAKIAGVEGEVTDMKASALKQYVARQAPSGFVLPTLRFGSRKFVATLLAGAPHPADVAHAWASAQGLTTAAKKAKKVS